MGEAVNGVGGVGLRQSVDLQQSGNATAHFLALAPTGALRLPSAGLPADTLPQRGRLPGGVAANPGGHQMTTSQRGGRLGIGMTKIRICI